ncbi:flagellar biosynthesis protein FlgJ [Janthinobacterium aquaticum]|uniref:flagellar biosynthesis protein FlgJ n=1 Tax=Janthinobacterium sp. FT58W TaxID=2654254 RepID=UPI0012652403|nr:flagellar biosynthesis protein FlgJ [Janthinobacterium sp. FT58W]KAB8044435.1 flagellar biosynthesis protein FlgJ [Janthinobacterium sp. FT58W]
MQINDSSSALPSALDDKSPEAAAPADPRYAAKATEAAVKFEAFFISHMLRQMRSGTREMAGDDSVYKDPVNADMLELADNLVADKMAGQRAFGIADAIVRQLLPAAMPAAKKIDLKSDNLAPGLNKSI